MLGDFQDKSVFDSTDLESVKNWRNVSIELHVDDCTDHLYRSTLTWEICPLRTVAALAVEKSPTPCRMKFRINIKSINYNKKIQLFSKFLIIIWLFHLGELQSSLRLQSIQLKSYELLYGYDAFLDRILLIN